MSQSDFYAQGGVSQIIFCVCSLARIKLINYNDSQALLNIPICTDLALSFNLSSSIKSQLPNILIGIISWILPEHTEDAHHTLPFLSTGRKRSLFCWHVFSQVIWVSATTLVGKERLFTITVFTLFPREKTKFQQDRRKNPDKALMVFSFFI